ncbi:MAG: F0F1 ATP synthase subunit epsilon [Firmicutes bacterium]|nr:F0F1 ATP synthase subunit epsilon [Bacillota bacterium]
MRKTILLEIVTPTRTELTRQVEYVVAPTPKGSIGILPGHAPLLTELTIGVLRFTAQGETTYMAVSEGYMEVTPEKVIVLAEAAELPEEIDVERALAAKRRAEERLYAPLRERIDYVRARAALQRAINRLQVAKRGARERRGAPGARDRDDGR